MNYGHRAISGFTWQTALKGAGAVLTIIKLSIVARILGPAEFGLFSLVTIALGIAEATTETGVNFTIINSKHSVSYFLNSAWVISIVRGFIIGLIMLVAALGLSGFFGEEQLLFLIALASLVPVIKGFINPAIVILRKELRFFHESLFSLTRMIAETIFAITLTIITRDVSALIYALVVAAIFEVFLSFALFKLRPSFQYLHSRGKIILSNAKGLSVSALLSYLNENLDNFLIGKIISPFGLGLYHNSYALTHRLTYDFSKSTAHSMLPIYSRLLSQPARLQKALLKSTASTLGLSLLVALPLLIYPQFLVILLGDQWQEAVPLVRILVLAGLLHSLSNLIYPYFYAKEKFYLVNWHLLASVVVLGVGITILGSWYGLVGAVWAVVLSRLITLPILGWGAGKVWQR